jgi:hypothetical protein
VVAAGAKVSVGAVKETLNGSPPATEYAMPLFASVICVENPRDPLLAIAFTLPVRVTVQLTVLVVMVGELQVAATPVGRPDVIAAVAPAPPAGTVTPPSAAAVSVTEAVPIEDIDNEECDSDILTPGACNTWTL